MSASGVEACPGGKAERYGMNDGESHWVARISGRAARAYGNYEVVSDLVLFLHGISIFCEGPCQMNYTGILTDTKRYKSKCIGYGWACSWRGKASGVYVGRTLNSGDWRLSSQ